MSNNVSDMTGQGRSVDSMIQQLESLQNPDRTSHSGGGGGDDMIERIAKLEAGQESLRREMDLRFDHLDKSLAEISKKTLSKWDMAQVVFFVVGALMAAVIFGPRVAAMLPPAG